MPGRIALPAIAPLDTARPDDVERLLDAAFGVDRHRRTAYRIREGMAAIPDLSLAAFDDDGALIGSLQSWPIALHGADGAIPLVLIGPVAVRPDLQRGGLGQTLMRTMLAREAAAANPLVLIGDPEYYGRFFGFTADATGGWEAPGPVERHRLLARAGGRTLPAAGMLGPRR